MLKQCLYNFYMVFYPIFSMFLKHWLQVLNVLKDILYSLNFQTYQNVKLNIKNGVPLIKYTFSALISCIRLAHKKNWLQNNNSFVHVCT
jgi:hypothetical protein